MEGHSTPPSRDGQGIKDEDLGSSSRKTKREMLDLERYRRDNMSKQYTNLESIIPDIPHKATRTRVIEEAISYIKGLERELGGLASLKREREASISSIPWQSLTGSSVNVSVLGGTVFFGLSSLSRPGLLTQVVQVFQNHRAEVLAATIACNSGIATVSITAMVQGEEVVDKIKGELLLI